MVAPEPDSSFLSHRNVFPDEPHVFGGYRAIPTSRASSLPVILELHASAASPRRPVAHDLISKRACRLADGGLPAAVQFRRTFTPHTIDAPCGSLAEVRRLMVTLAAETGRLRDTGRGLQGSSTSFGCSQNENTSSTGPDVKQPWRAYAHTWTSTTTTTSLFPSPLARLVR